MSIVSLSSITDRPFSDVSAGGGNRSDMILPLPRDELRDLR
ncbi:hypothetical protein ACE1CA_00845 [Aerosakkonemataceae cyanobacterium BLCC-F167]|uniref:Uncharacterized protein n=1 Tax=Floridaenema evergladense BLCC-F167 TaxID=3153639 RepID=A0ABV4WDB4_9CYAN